MNYNVFFVDQMARAYLLLCKVHFAEVKELSHFMDTGIFSLRLTFDKDLQEEADKVERQKKKTPDRKREQKAITKQNEQIGGLQSEGSSGKKAKNVKDIELAAFMPTTKVKATAETPYEIDLEAPNMTVTLKPGVSQTLPEHKHSQDIMDLL